MKSNNEFPDKDRKTDRRDKLKNKRNKPRYDDIDFPPKNVNKQVKKQKEDLQDEEWEDWERYYNR
jgi:predicted small lipoprotein YifL